MNLLPTNLRRNIEWAGSLALVCGLLFTPGLYAQTARSSSSSSINPSDNLYAENSSSSAYQSNYQYNNNNRYANQRTPRYTGNSWTDHLVLEGGGGVTAPAGDTQNFANTGWNVLLGAGVKFNDRLSLLAEWNFNRLGVPHSLAAGLAGTPDGNEHIWSIGLNPKFNFFHRDRANLYVIGGGGFSRALTNFTVPVLIPCYYFDFYGYPYPGTCVGDVTVSRTSSNQGMLDIGTGVEFRLSPYERGKLFVEARYEKLFSPNSGLPPGYRANLVPVTVGYRW